jgi:hypothetical protein
MQSVARLQNRDFCLLDARGATGNLGHLLGENKPFKPLGIINGAS